MSIEQEVQRSWHDAIVELFELDISGITGDGDDVFYFTREIFPDGRKVQWKGEVYEPFPIEITGFETTTKGPIPQPELTVANVLGTLAAATNGLDDLVGAKVTRRRTLAKYLDNGTAPDPSEEFPEDIYYIERKTSETNLSITWQLASKIDLEGLQLPRRVITQNYCLWQYRGPECGYTGRPVATERDGPLQGDGSAASATYINALRTFQAADNELRQATASLNLARGRAATDCDTNSLPSLRTYSNFNEPDYGFGIASSGQPLFAAVEGAAVDVLSQSADYRLGRTVRTGFGEDGNATGAVYAIDEYTVSGLTAVFKESLYSTTPPITLALQLGDSAPPRINLIIIVSGEIIPSETLNLQYLAGAQRGENIGIVTAVDQIDRTGTTCNSSTEALDDAQERYDEAVVNRASAEAALLAAANALPVGSAVFAEDVCGKRLSSCRLRFPTGGLPFGGFPGANITR